MGNERFTDDQRQSLDDRQGDQDRALAAMHELEAALESAAFGREATWGDDVVAALNVLREATADAAGAAAEPDSLLSDIARNQPRLRNRVRGIRAQYGQLLDRLDAIARESPDELDPADLRQRVAWVIGALRHVRARESDLIYEAYYDAFEADLADADRADT